MVSFWLAGCIVLCCSSVPNPWGLEAKPLAKFLSEAIQGLALGIRGMAGPHLKTHGDLSGGLVEGMGEGEFLALALCPGVHSVWTWPQVGLQISTAIHDFRSSKWCGFLPGDRQSPLLLLMCPQTIGLLCQTSVDRNLRTKTMVRIRA